MPWLARKGWRAWKPIGGEAMKPLVYYCRWQGASLRLRGRGETAVWGQLVFTGTEAETSQAFHFDLQTWELTLEDGEGKRTLQLDEMGIPEQTMNNE